MTKHCLNNNTLPFFFPSKHLQQHVNTFLQTHKITFWNLLIPHISCPLFVCVCFITSGLLSPDGSCQICVWQLESDKCAPLGVNYISTAASEQKSYNFMHTFTSGYRALEQCFKQRAIKDLQKRLDCVTFCQLFPMLCLPRGSLQL